MTGRPTVQVLLDDGTGTFPHDVTAYVRQSDGVDFNRGRPDEHSGTAAGFLNMVFNNAGGEFTRGSTVLASPSPIVVDQRIRYSESFLSNLTFDDGVTGWTGGNAAVASVATPVRNGAGAMRLTAIAGADMSGFTASGTSGVPVTPGATYRLSGWFRTAVTARSCFVRVRFYDSGGSLLSTVVSDDVVNTTTGWTQASTTTVVPASAAFAAISAVVKAPAAGEVHYVDDMWFGLDRHTGYVKKWPVSWPGGGGGAHAVARITATCAQARAERTPLRSLVAEEILADASAAWYYTLGEAEGSTSAVDSSGNQAPMLTVAGSGTTDPAFGTAAWEEPVGAGTTGVQFTATTGRYLHAPTSQSFGAGTGSASFVCLFRSATTTSAALIRGGGDFNSNLVAIQTGATGYLRTDLGGGINSSPTSANDDLDHTAIVTDDGTTTKLYLDGALVGSGASTGWNLTEITIGGAPNNAPNVLGDVTIGHASGFTAALSAAQVLSIHEALTTGFDGEAGTDRITRIAGYAGIPLGALDTSLTDVPFKDFAGTSAWSAIQDVTAAEGGLSLVDGSGNLIFINRNDPVEKAAPDLTISAAFVAPDVEPIDDDAEIINYFESTAESTGVAQVVRDTTSEDAHGRYPESKTYLVQTDAEALDRANWIVATQAEPSTRYGSLPINLLNMSAAQQEAAITGLEPGAWLRITGMNSQTPDSTTVDVMVQGFSEKLTADEWSLTLNVTARERYDGVWILDTSALDVDTKLYY